MRETSSMSPAAALGVERAVSTAQSAVSAHAEQPGAALINGYQSASSWGADAQEVHAPAGSAADASGIWGVLLAPDGAQVGREVRGLMTQSAAPKPLAPDGAPGGAPSSMPQPIGAPWHAAAGARVSQGTDASIPQGEELAAAPLASARAEPGPHVAPTQGMQHGVPSAAHGGADAQPGMPPARSPDLRSGLDGDAAERVAGQPPAASPAGSLADSLAEMEARPQTNMPNCMQKKFNDLQDSIGVLVAHTYLAH